MPRRPGGRRGRSINDRLGHDAGDAALRQAAHAIGQVLRADDVAGRFGGDEFVVCLVAEADVIEAASRTVAARLIERIGAVGDGLGCSVGIAVAARGGRAHTLQRLLAEADAAMLQAKRAGKNRFMRFAAGPALVHRVVDASVCRPCAAPDVAGPDACRGCRVNPQSP